MVTPSSLRQEHIGRWVFEIHRDFQRRALRELQHLGHRLTPGLISLLPHLDERGTTVSAAAGAAGISKQAVGKLVDELVRLGYVERRPHPEDGRASIVAFTAQGQRLVTDIVSTISAIEHAYAAAIGAKDFERLSSLLAKLRTTVAAANADP